MRYILALILVILVILGSAYLATIQDQPESLVISPSILVDPLVTPVPEPTRTPEPTITNNIPNWDNSETRTTGGRLLEWNETP